MNNASTTSTQLKDRVLHLLRELEAEIHHGEADERRGQRLSVQAPVLIGHLQDEAAQQSAVADRTPSETNFPFSRQFCLICHGWATDLSHSGIGILTEQPLDVNATVHVSLQALLNEPLLVPVRIMYTRRIFTHTYRAGGHFQFD